MLGRPVTEFISDEVKAEHSALAIAAALELEPSDERDDLIERNARHLQIVIDVLDIGFIAQDLVAVEDDLEAHDWLQLTLRDNPDRLEATQGRLIPILVKAIQELSAEIETLKAQVAK